MISIVDYGLGNIKAFENLLYRLGFQTKRVQTANDLKGCEKLILPGVGAFDEAMELLEASGMRSSLDDLVLNQKIPIIGICVGMQIMATSSDEGKRKGLDWIPGHVRSFRSVEQLALLPVPHMGWNSVTFNSVANSICQGLNSVPRFYFLHSYFYETKERENALATSFYGFDFDVVVTNNNIFGVQFHPEKSHGDGAKILENFAKL